MNQALGILQTFVTVFLGIFVEAVPFLLPGPGLRPATGCWSPTWWCWAVR